MSGASRYRHLFTPLRIGPVTVRNRIVFSAHLTNYAERRPAHRAARRLLRGAGGRRRRPDHHRGALDPPHRLALREAHPRVPPRGDRRLPPDHRRRPRPRRADLRPDQPQRRPGLVDVLPAAGVGAQPGARPAVPRGPQGGRAARDRRDRRRLRHRSPRTASTAASTASSCSAPTRRSCAGFLSPATNLRTDALRRLAGQPGPAAAGDRRRGARGHRAPTGPSACASAATS